MLYHRLPLDDLALGAASFEMAPPRVDAAPPVPLRMVTLGLLLPDVVAASLPWALLPAAAMQQNGTGILQHGSAIAAAAAIWLMAASVAQLYEKKTMARFPKLVVSALLASCLAFGPALLVTLAVWPGGSLPLKAILAPQLVAFAWVILSRMIWAAALGHLLKSGFCIERVAVFGEKHSAARIFAAEIERATFGRLRAVSFFATPGEGLGERLGAELPAMRAAIAKAGVTHILVTGSRDASSAGTAAFAELAPSVAGFTYFPPSGRPYGLMRTASDLPAVNEARLPLSVLQQAAKRSVDIAGASALIMLSLPLLMSIAVMVKVTSQGPAIFRQDRVGKDGAVFRMLKFRTMFAQPPDRLNPLQTQRADPRVTPIGRFLRRTSLDELPQLMNVLCGDMSIVGPRPHAVGMLVAGQIVEAITPDYAGRHRVKPGITGWAQVNGSRGALESARALRRRVALDQHYIENWSLLMDTRIMLRTASLIVFDRYAF